MKGKLSITRPHISKGKEKIVLEVKDVLSNVQFLTVEVDLDVFTRALTGRSEVDCDMKFRALDRIGIK